MRSKEELVARLSEGTRVKYLFFWGHTPKTSGAVDASCLSQWFPRAFVVEGESFATAEHYMMAEKARLMGDLASRAKVLAAGSPAEAKALGRTVAPYDDALWARERFDAVVRGNVAKFGAHDDLRAFLLATGDRVLVEASPRDAVWGIGLGASSPQANDPSQWRGLNLLGFALMEARARLREA